MPFLFVEMLRNFKAGILYCGAHLVLSAVNYAGGDKHSVLLHKGADMGRKGNYYIGNNIGKHYVIAAAK